MVERNYTANSDFVFIVLINNIFLLSTMLHMKTLSSNSVHALRSQYQRGSFLCS